MAGSKRADRSRRLRHDSQAVLASGEEARRAHGLPREGPRHLARDLVARVRRARQGGRHGPGEVRPEPRPGRVGAGRDRAGMALCRHGQHGRGRRQQRHLSDQFGQAGRVHPERQPHPLPVRRERGAARQVPRDPRALPRPRQGLRLRHGGPGRLQRPDGHAVRRAARARPRLRQGQPRPVGEAGRELAGRGAGDPRLHLRHDRAAQGRDAVAPQRHLPAQQRRRLHPDREGRRAARLPAALPRRRAHLHGLPAAALGRHRQLRRERRDGAGQHPGSGTDDVLRRAAHLGALLFRHRHPHEGGDLDRPRLLQVGDRAGTQGGRCRARRAQARAIPEARPRHRRLAGARQHQARHRPASREVRRHRCRADRARPHQVVSRARRRHARGLRPDRELRSGDRHARPHQARHRRRHRAAHRDRRSRPRARSCSRARTSSWAT